MENHTLPRVYTCVNPDGEIVVRDFIARETIKKYLEHSDTGVNDSIHIVTPVATLRNQYEELRHERDEIYAV